jgi:hypothetical protein
MTTTSALSATETPSTATPTASTARVRIPGSARTYEVRDALRGMGLRWDPASHAWHGWLPASDGATLEQRFGLRPQVVRAIETFSSDAPTPATPTRPVLPAGPRPPYTPHVPRDGSRTCAEARVAYRDLDEDAEEVATQTRRFSVFEITSGLPDDSREAEEKLAERRVRGLRARVKAARAAVATSPGVAEILVSDWKRAAHFYARFGVSEDLLRNGVRGELRDDNDNPVSDFGTSP